MDGGIIMAQRWTFEEDYIVCKFCQEKKCNDITDHNLDELMIRLNENGFSSRSKIAVEKRARDYTYLLRGWESQYAVSQVRTVFQCLTNSYEVECQQWIGRYIDEVYSPESNIDKNEDWTETTDTGLNRFLILDALEEEKSFHKVFNELLDNLSSL